MPKLLPKQKIQAQKDLINAWAHPIGTPVAVRLDSGSVTMTVTRSMPWMLGNYAVILVGEITGCYRLDRLNLRKGS